MFKAGDRVICIEDNCGIKKGEIHTVTPHAGGYFSYTEVYINAGDGPYINHPLNINYYKLYNKIEIKEEKDYYAWLANR